MNLEKVDVFELAEQYPEAFDHPYEAETGQIAIDKIVEGA